MRICCEKKSKMLDDIHDLPKVIDKVFEGHPEFTHTFIFED